MKVRTLVLTAVTAASMIAGAGVARAENQLQLNVYGIDNVAKIEVEGSNKNGPYDRVKPGDLRYLVSVRGAWNYNGTGRPPFWIWLAPHVSGRTVSDDLTTDWVKYQVTRPYIEPQSPQAANLRVSPITLCNEILAAAKANGNSTFMRQGQHFLYADAYKIGGNVYVTPAGAHNPNAENYVELKVPVRIHCLPLNPSPPPATRDKADPLFSTVSLRAEPAQIVQMGKFICPSKIKLYGRVEATRKFQGKALFVGPYYISNITPLNFPGKGARNVTGTYTMNWEKKGGLTTAPNTEPKKQKLTFRFNIADNGGELWGSAEKTIEVSCRKIKTNAPTAGDGMTVNPAN